ncbi:MAG: hypothetical protein IKH14_01600 [Prevotella sp.]|nr:hypothetical protein [Prevotella sp.]MBR3444554.1 hypothetical protein [Prevotella sp.]
MKREKKVYAAPLIKKLGIETENDIAVSLPIDGGDTPIDPGNAESPGFPKGPNVWEDELE